MMFVVGKNSDLVADHAPIQGSNTRTLIHHFMLGSHSRRVCMGKAWLSSKIRIALLLPRLLRFYVHAILVMLFVPFYLNGQVQRIYIANDDHTDLMWGGMKISIAMHG